MTLFRVFLPLISCFALAHPLRAHPSQQNAMWVQFEPSQVHVAIDVSLKELAAVWGVALEPNSPPEIAGIEEAAQKHTDYVLGHLILSVRTSALRGRSIKFTPPATMGDPERTFFQYELEYPFHGSPPSEVNFYHDMLKEWPYSPGTPWDVSYIIRAKRQGSDVVNSWLLGFQKSTPLSTGCAEDARPETRVSTASSVPSFFKDLWQSMLRMIGR